MIGLFQYSSQRGITRKAAHFHLVIGSFEDWVDEYRSWLPVYLHQ